MRCSAPLSFTNCEITVTKPTSTTANNASLMLPSPRSLGLRAHLKLCSVPELHRDTLEPHGIGAPAAGAALDVVREPGTRGALELASGLAAGGAGLEGRLAQSCFSRL